MNRAQRRAQAKKGRVTPKKERMPRAFATVTDGEGNEKRVAVHGERVSREEMERAQAEQAEQAAKVAEHNENRARLIAHSHGLWLPGDPV